MWNYVTLHIYTLTQWFDSSCTPPAGCESAAATVPTQGTQVQAPPSCLLSSYFFSDCLLIGVNFKIFIDEAYKLFDNPKYALNTLIRIFGHNYESRNIHHFTQDNRSVLNELKKNKDAKVSINLNLWKIIRIINYLYW